MASVSVSRGRRGSRRGDRCSQAAGTACHWAAVRRLKRCWAAGSRCALAAGASRSKAGVQTSLTMLGLQARLASCGRLLQALICWAARAEGAFAHHSRRHSSSSTRQRLPCCLERSWRSCSARQQQGGTAACAARARLLHTLHNSSGLQPAGQSGRPALQLLQHHARYSSEMSRRSCQMEAPAGLLSRGRPPQRSTAAAAGLNHNQHYRALSQSLCPTSCSQQTAAWTSCWHPSGGAQQDPGQRPLQASTAAAAAAAGCWRLRRCRQLPWGRSSLPCRAASTWRRRVCWRRLTASLWLLSAAACCCLWTSMLLVGGWGLRGWGRGCSSRGGVGDSFHPSLRVRPPRVPNNRR